jgi:DNA polymerase-3 subunit beta
VLRYCAPAMCQDESRFHLNGVMLRAGGGVIRGAATSGNNIHVAERTSEVSWDGDAIVPAKAVKALTRLLDGEVDALIARDKEILHVRCGGSRLSAKLHDATFVQFEKPIENALGANKGTIDLNRHDLLAAVERTQLTAGEDVRAIAMTFSNNTVALRSKDADGRVAEDAIESNGKIAEVTTGTNPRFMTLALAALGGDKVTLRLGRALDAIVIHRAGESVTAQSGDLCIFSPMVV